MKSSESKKFPEIRVKLIGENGNIYNLIGIVVEALRRNGKSEYIEEFIKDTTSSNSYEEALCVIDSWVEIQ